MRITCCFRRGHPGQFRQIVHGPSQPDAGSHRPAFQSKAQAGKHGHNVMVDRVQRVDHSAQIVDRIAKHRGESLRPNLVTFNGCQRSNQQRAQAVVHIPGQPLAFQQQRTLVLRCRGSQPPACGIFLARVASFMPARH
jgi:hypothetical protein